MLLTLLVTVLSSPGTNHRLFLKSFFPFHYEYSQDVISIVTEIEYLLLQIKYFSDPTVAALQYIDVLEQKDLSQKQQFFCTLPDHLPSIPKVINSSAQEE